MDLEIVENDVIVGNDLVDVVWEGGENVLLDGSFKPIEVEEDEEDVIFSSLEAFALFNGKSAEEGFREYIRNNLNYPQIAIDNGISGTVFIQFVIDQKGNVVDVQVVRKADPSLENEAVRLIKSSSGMWTPGKQRNKPVKVRYTFPITFRLQ